MYSISKTFRIEAAHRLLGMPAGHQCARLHGHSYRVRLTLAATALDARGFVLDYGDLRPFGVFLDATLDHRTLLRESDPLVSTLRADDPAQVVGLPFNPSAENLARWLHGEACRLLPGAMVVACSVSETGKTWATHRADVFPEA